MRIQLLSDIHLEMAPKGFAWKPSVPDADVTILAGDIHKGTRGMDWPRETFSGHVLYVAGNHECWGGHLQRTTDKLRAAACEHVRFLERDEVIIGGVRFLGATAWTDYTATGDELAARHEATLRLNDFRHIRAKGQRLARPSGPAGRSLGLWPYPRRIRPASKGHEAGVQRRGISRAADRLRPAANHRHLT